jgi:ATP-binding protein involved in chromosome partitioning
MPTEQQIRAALSGVLDAARERSIVELDMVRAVATSPDGDVTVTLALPNPDAPIRATYETQVRTAVQALAGTRSVEVAFEAQTDAEREAAHHRAARRARTTGPVAGVREVVCVGSGKGGVGKSTVTANLAAALAAEGKQVGVLDADVWGYSIPRMLGLQARPGVNGSKKIVPPLAHGVRVMSIGFFVEEDAAVVWRGPMLHKALGQFLKDVDWGTLDYLLVDLPPGTGDVSMTIAQLLPHARFLLVTTPQPAAQKVARRAADMAAKVNLQVAGVIENMAGFVTPEGSRYPIFGEGGGQALAGELDVPLVGKIPLTMPLREQSDAGLPLVLAHPHDPAAQALRQAARGLLAQGPVDLPLA